ncbi:hypothetical protein ACFLYT_02010, partial [Nanoarchaeota archaeon]
DLFATTKLNEVQQDDVFRMWCSRCDQGMDIANPDNTLLEQMSEFYHQGEPYYGYAETIARSISKGLVKPQYSYAVYINKTLIYNLTKHNEENASLLITSKKLVYGMLDQELWGPYIAEVRVWQ